jgi:hypothetical protein
MENAKEHSELLKLIQVAKDLQRGHMAEENEKQLLKKGLRDLIAEELDNLNQLKPRLFWSMVKILSEVDTERLKEGLGEEEDKEEEEGGKEGKIMEKGRIFPIMKKTKNRREVKEPCAACELMRSGCDKMEVEVERVIDLFKNQQPIDTRNQRWIEEIVKQGHDLADFSSPVRTDNLPQKLNPKTEKTDEMLSEVGEPIAGKIAALVILSGKTVWEIENKRRENLYGNAAAAMVKGMRTLTDPRIDSNTAYKNAN